MYARFNKTLRLLTYTDEEYERYFQGPAHPRSRAPSVRPIPKPYSRAPFARATRTPRSSAPFTRPVQAPRSSAAFKRPAQATCLRARTIRAHDTQTPSGRARRRTASLPCVSSLTCGSL